MRAVILLLLALLALPARVPELFGLMAALVYLTVAQRVWWAWRNLTAQA